LGALFIQSGTFFDVPFSEDLPPSFDFFLVVSSSSLGKCPGYCTIPWGLLGTHTCRKAVQQYIAVWKLDPI